MHATSNSRLASIRAKRRERNVADGLPDMDPGGCRAQESAVRKIAARKNNSRSSCWPICWWTVADVFGYLAASDLPVHPAYAMTGAGRWDREQIRVSILGGQKGRNMGRTEWECEYYGDVVRRLEG